MKLNQAGLQLILDYEVGGGKPYYDKYCLHPVWPGGRSGITIGIGYDLGQCSQSEFMKHWGGVLSLEDLDLLRPCVGVCGGEALKFLDDTKDIFIPWDIAFSVWQSVSVPKALSETVRVFPGIEDLHPNCQGALCSLIFNRGPSLAGENRREMRVIAAFVKLRDYRGIAREIREMKRLWVGTSIAQGMAKRRDAEADLVLASLG